MTEPKRYQDCPWYVRLWRRRWYLLVPWWTLRFRFTPWVEPDTGEIVKDEPYNSWETSWKIALGTATGKMNWYYTWDEVKERLGISLEDDDDI